MALFESAIGGIAVKILETIFKAGDAVADQIKGSYNETQAKQRAIVAAQNYVQRYEKRHCQIKVMPGLMKEPLPLEEIYTAVKLLDDQNVHCFVGLDDLEESYRTKGQRSFGQSDNRQDGMFFADQEQYLMVLGDPGIGKSTFLRKIGLEALKQGGQIQRDCIPVLIELKEFRDETCDLKQKITAEFETCGFPEAVAFTEASLEQGKLMILLDGLDEVPTSNLNRVIEHIENFVDAHDSNTFVASCRIAAYRSSQGVYFQRFTDVTLAEFDDEQIEQFIRRWFNSELDRSAGTAGSYWALLKKDENKATKELAQTPLLLTFLCLVYDRQQVLPTQRSTLYGKALDILLSEWSAQKRLEHDPIYEGFHPDLEKVLLSQIAYDSFKKDQFFFLKNDITSRISKFLAETLDAPKYLDGAALLRAIEKQQGILVQRATNIYSFSHLTLQEYLTAFRVIEARLEANLINQYLTDERWQEVFLLVAGLSGDRAIDMLNALYQRANACIENHPRLFNLLYWATVSTEDSIGSYQPAAKRAAAITIASNIAIARAFSNDIAIASDIPNSSAGAIDNTIGSTSDSAFAIASAIDGAINSASAIAFAIDNDINVDRDIGIGIPVDINVNIADIFMSIFRSSKFAVLPHQLKRMFNEIPDGQDSSQKWLDWADELNTLRFETLGLDEAALMFTREEFDALRDYLYSTELLIRCKDAAVRVTKHAWADLEARLLTV